MSAFLMSALLIHCFFILAKLCTLRDCSVKKSVRHGGFFLRHCQRFKDVWIQYCILSCLGECLGGTVATEFAEINIRLKKQRAIFQNTMAFLPNGTYYTPGICNGNCTRHMIRCFVVELQVIMLEADVKIDSFWEDLKNNLSEDSACPRCEEYEDSNALTFLDGFDIFMKSFQHV